jgi:Cu+-exporting ATPase
MATLTRQRISILSSFLRCSFLSVCHVAVITAHLTFSPGRYLEAYSRSRTGDAITSLSSLKPAEALIVGLSDEKRLLGGFHSIQGDIEKGDASAETEVQWSEPGSRVQKISADFFEIGDVVRVPSGSTPPMDGTVASGHSLFDESSVTGESKPVKKCPGDRVFLGTINVGNVIDVRIDVAEGKTMLVLSSFSSCGQGLT